MRDGRPVSSDGTRLISWTDADDVLYEMTIVEFVVLKTVEILATMGEDTNVENIAEKSGPVAEYLAEEGWFTWNEYLAAVAHDEASTIDEELKSL